MKQQVGVIGMAVMGKNLALNLESRGLRVAIYNRTVSRAQEVIAEHPDKHLVLAENIQEFVEMLERPRKVILMVQAGRGTDAVIQQLIEYLEPGDIIIDGGNTFFKDTMERYQRLEEQDLLFLGTGISGGEEGALHGPSIMPGGSYQAYQEMEDILKSIAAKTKEGMPCVTYIGPNGAGHYVKMVHNGIEYGDMQLISEVYDLLNRGFHLSYDAMSELFSKWNQGELNSYLMEITANILNKKDELTGNPMLEVILDKAGNKGTGKWTSQSALDLGVPLPLITESVFARYLSAFKAQREHASQLLKGPEEYILSWDKIWEEKIRKALYFSKIMSYAQGFTQLMEASKHYQWDLNYGAIASIWQEGCIIRAQFLKKITEAYEQNPDLEHLLFAPYFLEIINEYHQDVRDVVSLALKLGIPVPTLSAAITYYDGFRSKRLPANMIQAQRDYFGAHTFERIDTLGTFHIEW